MRSSSDFAAAVRRGRRAGRRTLVVHGVRSGEAVPARVGFVVSRAVGGAVERNRVKRQLRHLVASHLGDVPAGWLLVVRANPASATEGDRLRRDLDGALRAMLDGGDRVGTSS